MSDKDFYKGIDNFRTNKNLWLYVDKSNKFVKLQMPILCETSEKGLLRSIALKFKIDVSQKKFWEIILILLSQPSYKKIFECFLFLFILSSYFLLCQLKKSEKLIYLYINLSKCDRNFVVKLRML